METTEKVSEDELGDLLPDDVESFIRFLVEDYGKSIMAYLGKVSQDVLSESELADAYQETLIAVWKKVSEPDFIRERPLRMVFAIARIKALDALRNRMRRKKKPEVNESDVTNLIISDLKDSRLGMEWKYANEEEKNRLFDVLPEVIAGLTDRQKAAVAAFYECYAEIRANNKYKPLALAMGGITGKDETVAAAKSALNAALGNIRKELVRRNITFVEGRDT